MAELGEAPPPDFMRSGNGTANGVQRKNNTGINMFDPQMAPRPLMPPPMPNAPMVPNMPNGMAGMPPPWVAAPNMSWQPGPPGSYFCFVLFEVN